MSMSFNKKRLNNSMSFWNIAMSFQNNTMTFRNKAMSFGNITMTLLEHRYVLSGTSLWPYRNIDMSFKSHNPRDFILYKANIESHISSLNKYINKIYKQDINKYPYTNVWRFFQHFFFENILDFIKKRKSHILEILFLSHQ